MDMEGGWSSEGPSTDLSGGNPNPFDPHTAHRESTQPCSVRSFLELASLEHLTLTAPLAKTDSRRLDLPPNARDRRPPAT